MRLLRYIGIILLLIIATYSGIWYYVMHKLASQFHAQYGTKPITIQTTNGLDYNLSFAKISPTGFPFKLALKITDWREETKSSDTYYQDPIIAGYDLAKQQIFVSFSGDIKSYFKPVMQNFGALIKAKNYNIAINLPLTRELLNFLKKMQDPFELINYTKVINITTGRVEVFDINNNKEKFYDKEFEHINFHFEPAKWYTSWQELNADIPKEFDAKYEVKTNKVTEPSRNLPFNLFYSFYHFPSEIYGKGEFIAKTEAKTLDELAKDISFKLDFNFTSPFADLNSYNLSYTADLKDKKTIFSILSNAKFSIKPGAFDELFKYYGIVREQIIKKPLVGRLIDNEINYIINNKTAFKFSELESKSYDFNINIKGNDNNTTTYLTVEDFSLFSNNTGIKLSHNSEIHKTYPRKWLTQGTLLLHNYGTIVDFSSAYIYRFGKFKDISDQARNIYVTVNKNFLKKISDHPYSDSNDLSFEYEVNSEKLTNTKFGNVRFDQLTDLYQKHLLDTLVEHVEAGPGILGRMKSIIPDLDENSEIVKRVIPNLEKIPSLLAPQ